MKKWILGILGMIVLLILIVGLVFGPAIRRLMESSTEVVDSNLTVFLGYGGNSIVLKSDDGSQILVVDTKMGGGSKKLKEHVDAVSMNAQVTVVNTHFHGDHSGGNEQFAGARFIAGAYDSAQWMKETGMDRMPDDAIPAGEELVLTIGDEMVHVRNMGRAHTWNDVIVYLENRKLLAVGDLIFNGWHPALFKHKGTYVQGWIDALNRLIEEYDVRTVVTGHGPLSDQQALLDMREYFVSISEAIGDDARLQELKQKYKDYFSLPMTSGFDKTVDFIEAERTELFQ